jgi:hypothetical protein
MAAKDFVRLSSKEEKRPQKDASLLTSGLVANSLKCGIRRTEHEDKSMRDCVDHLVRKLHLVK